ncbi:hypothetical protein [Azospirillum sp. ST 5-10]|uniref:hypothetical protein n=1 Tax=unclassified Azospirillum TaxID=2630922 RepID=UPI003F49F425
MTEPAGGAPLDAYRDVLGVALPPERLAADLRAYADILEAIRALRTLDLTDTHPAVVFDPTLPYRGGGLP